MRRHTQNNSETREPLISCTSKTPWQHTSTAMTHVRMPNLRKNMTNGRKLSYRCVAPAINNSLGGDIAWTMEVTDSSKTVDPVNVKVPVMKNDWNSNTTGFEGFEAYPIVRVVMFWLLERRNLNDMKFWWTSSRRVRLYCCLSNEVPRLTLNLESKTELY